MPRKMLPFDLLQENPTMNDIRLPEGFEYRGLEVVSDDPLHVRVWFEADTNYHADRMRLILVADGADTPKDGRYLKSIVCKDKTSRHVFLAKNRPACKCECATKGECEHEWNGENLTCSSCDITLKEHKFPPRFRTSPYPRLRNKSYYQKDDCIACNNPSTKEVVLGQAYIRCCGNTDCIDRAIELAKVTSEIFNNG